MVLLKGKYTGGWMSTLSPGSVKARMAADRAVSTPGVWQTHSGGMFHPWSSCTQPVKAAK